MRVQDPQGLEEEGSKNEKNIIIIIVYVFIYIFGKWGRKWNERRRKKCLLHVIIDHKLALKKNHYQTLKFLQSYML